MHKIYNHLLDNNNKIFKPVFFLTLIYFSYSAFRLNNYALLFIDERLLIDDIYNVWLLEDIFVRYANIENKFLKNLLIILTEISYGGDLRYGRLFSNIYTLLIGPLTMISHQLVISFSRIFNLIFLILAFFIFSKNFINEKFYWKSLLILFSLPGAELLLRIPKPEAISITFVTTSFYFLKKNKNFKAIYFALLASFLKVNYFPVFLFTFFFIFLNENRKLIFILKTSILSFFAMVTVNPILILPPIKLSFIELPNFYKIYISWIVSQGSYGQETIFNLNYMSNWVSTLSKFYSLNIFLVFVLLFLIFSFLISSLSKEIKLDDRVSKVMLCSALFYLLFYLFFIERQFIWYLFTPFMFIFLYYLKEFDYFSKFKNMYFLIILFLFLGFASNLSTFNKEKNFTANFKAGYENIISESDAINLVEEVLLEVEKIYIEKDYENSIVYWDPELFIPRNKVTYDKNFYVREFWGNQNEVFENANIFVTNKNLNFEGVSRKKVKNYIIYFK